MDFGHIEFTPGIPRLIDVNLFNAHGWVGPGTLFGPGFVVVLDGSETGFRSRSG
jgi:hypothetical protein